MSRLLRNFSLSSIKSGMGVGIEDAKRSAARQAVDKHVKVKQFTSIFVNYFSLSE